MKELDYIEESVYNDAIEEDTSSLVDDDEISPEEEAFMRGYEEADYASEETAEEEL